MLMLWEPVVIMVATRYIVVMPTIFIRPTWVKGDWQSQNESDRQSNKIFHIVERVFELKELLKELEDMDEEQLRELLRYIQEEIQPPDLRNRA